MCEQLPLRGCGEVGVGCCWGVVVLGEECEPGFEGCVRSRIGQGEKVCFSGGSKDVLVEKETFKVGGEVEYGCMCFAWSTGSSRFWNGVWYLYTDLGEVVAS